MISSFLTRSELYWILGIAWHSSSVWVSLFRFCDSILTQSCIKIYSRLRFAIFPLQKSPPKALQLILFSLFRFPVRALDEFWIFHFTVFSQKFPKTKTLTCRKMIFSTQNFPSDSRHSTLIQLSFANFPWAFSFPLIFSLLNSLSCRKMCVTPSEWNFQLFSRRSDNFEWSENIKADENSGAAKHPHTRSLAFVMKHPHCRIAGSLLPQHSPAGRRGEGKSGRSKSTTALGWCDDGNPSEEVWKIVFRAHSQRKHTAHRHHHTPEHMIAFHEYCALLVAL